MSDIYESFDIRHYGPADAEAVQSLHVAALESAGAYIPGPWDSDIDDIAGHYQGPNGVFLVGTICERAVEIGTPAVSPEHIIAMGGLRRLHDDVVEIKRLRVDPAYQGRGYGRRVILRLESFADTMQASEIRLDTTDVQIPAQRLFRDLGYSVMVRQPIRGGRTILYFQKLLEE